MSIRSFIKAIVSGAAKGVDEKLSDPDWDPLAELLAKPVPPPAPVAPVETPKPPVHTPEELEERRKHVVNLLIAAINAACAGDLSKRKGDEYSPKFTCGDWTFTSSDSFLHQVWYKGRHLENIFTSRDDSRVATILHAKIHKYREEEKRRKQADTINSFFQ